ncbi:MAG: hypothetical protein IT230_05755, partial [Flavobacteriales bacterium]|nr:hypothetical protein [Flavobacteriales bacterium]
MLTICIATIGWSLAAQAQNVNVTATAGTPAATYATLSAAFAAINAGTHQGTITCTVVANTTEPASPTSLLRSNAPSSYTSILVNCTGNVTVNSAAVPTFNRGIIELRGADNVTIDGDDPLTQGDRNLTIQMATTTTAGTQCVRLASNSTTGTDGADNNMVKNCNIIGGRSSATSTISSWGILMSNGASGTGGAYASLNTLIENNAITRCFTGIGAMGASTTYRNLGTIIRNNVLGSATSADNIGFRGINISYSANTAGVGSATISNNDIRVGDYGTTGYQAIIAGIEVGTVNAGLVVDRNNIHDINQPDISGYGAHGIYVTSGLSSAGMAITNNMIRDCRNVVSQTSMTSAFIPSGVFISGAGATNVQFDHNTVSMTTQLGSGANFSSFGVNASVSGVTFASFRNNIISNTHASTEAYGFATYGAWGLSGALVDNNAYWVPGGHVGYYNAANQTTLGAWQTATGKDAAAINLAGPFMSSTNLHVDLTNPNAIAFNGTGATGTGVAHDFENDTRGTPPDIGADEFILPSCVAANGGTITPSSASICNNSTYVMSTTGSEVGAGVTFQWEVSSTGGGVGFADVSGGSGATSTSYTTDALTTGTYYYRLRVTCSNGPVTGYSNELTLTVNPPPSVNVDVPSANYCVGNTAVAITASGASTYAWSPATGLDATNVATVNASPMNTTTYMVTGTDGNGCTNTATATVNAVNAPIVESATANPNPTCVNGTSVLNATAIIPGTVDQYVFASSVGTFNSIVGQPGTVQINTGGDDTGYGPYPLGFTFNFNGINFTSAGVNANGFVAMGALASGSYTVLSGSLNNVIAAFNGDLYGLSANGAQMSYQLSGTPGSQVFTFEWTNWGFYSTGLNEASFQVKLYEGSNTVQIVYQNGTGTSASYVQVGLRGSSDAVFSNRTTTTDWTATIAGGTNIAFCAVSATVRPVNGLTFTWTPPSLLGATYTWTPNTFLDDPSLQSPTASLVNVASIGYQVTATYSGCPSANFGSVTLTTTAPITAATITGTLEYCAGGSASLTAVPTDGAGPYTYLWSPGGETTASIAASAPGLYNCQVTDGCGGSVNTGDVTVTELASPTVVVSPTSALLCDGASQVLTAIGTDSYAWSPAAGLDMVTGATVTATPASTTTYTVTGTAVNGCTGTATATLTVGTTPVVNNVTATPPTVCNGGNSQLQVAVAGPAAYCNSYFSSVTWQYITNVTFAGINNTSAGNTGGPVDYTAQVASVIAGSSYNLDVTMQPDGFDYIYAWFDWNQNGVLNDVGEAFTVVANSIASGPHTISIPVPANAPNGNTRMRVMVDNNNATPTPCRMASYGEAEDYTVNVSGSNDAYTFSWTPATYLSSTTIANPVATNVTGPVMYTVTATAITGCASEGTIQLNPTTMVSAASITGNLAFCTGDSTTLTAVPADGGGPFTYLWSPGGETTDSIVVTTAGSYSCQVTDNCGGSVNTGSVNTGSVSVVENFLPTVVVDVPSANYCTGSPAIAITASGASTYAWSPAAGLDATNVATVNANPTSTTTYTVTGTDGNGCQNTATATMTVGTTPVVNNVTATPPTVCIGGNSQLKVNMGSYCNSNFTNVGYEFLTNVTFGGINSTSGGVAGGPVDYTAQVANVTAGGNYLLSVTIMADASEYVYAWFDWNQNGVLNDVGEAFTVVANSSAAGPHTISIPVPANATNGNTRMRVMVDYNNATRNPCRSAIYGEAEDYTVNVSGGYDTYTFSWTPATYLSSTSIASPMASGITAPVDYTVTVTSALGCSADGAVSVTLDNTDTDSDGTADCTDSCPTDPLKTAPGICGCGVADVPASYYVDGDGDGYGTGALVPGFFTCTVPAGYSATAGDCNDNNGNVNPGAMEVCDGFDNDCNGTVDDPTSFGIGLVGHWAFNNDLNDRTDNNNNGSAPSGASYATGIDGAANGAFQFGGGRYVVVPHNAAYNFGTGDFTYSVWLNWGSTSYASIIDKNDYGGGGGYTLNCFVDYPAAGNFMGRPGEVVAGTGLGNNTWRHVVMTRTGTTVRIYLNGVLSNTASIASINLTTPSNIFIGRHGSSNMQGYSGKMDNLRLYNRAITAQEVTDLYTHEQVGNLDGVGNVTFYTDADGDGYGDPATATTDCEQPPGTVLVGGDCNDNDPDIHPGASEVCDGADNDCANGVDDGLTMVNYWPDSDGDGFGDQSASVVTACAPPSGHVTNNTDACPNDPLKQVSGACGCGNVDTDSDTDGTADCIDGCPNDPLKTSPGQCNCGNPDTDSDTDGTADCVDSCPNDPLKTTAGQCGCGNADTDDDADGTANCNDGCPNDPLKTDPGTCGCGVDDAMFTTWYPDADGDGYGDPYGAIQNCNATPPAGHVAIDGDCDDNDDTIWQSVELYVDVDGDGYDMGMEWVCYGASVPAGYSAGTSGADCNDADANLTAQGNPCDDGDPGTGTSFVTPDCQCVPPPVNDAACNAIALSFGMNGPFTNVGATLEPGEPTTYDPYDWSSSWTTAADQTVWFTFVAPAHGRVDLNFGDGTWDSQIALWAAADCNALLAGGATLLGASDKIGSFFSIGALDDLCLTPGTTYYVQVDAGDANGIASFELHLIDDPLQGTMVAEPTTVVSGGSSEIHFEGQPGTTFTYSVNAGPTQTVFLPDYYINVNTGPLTENTTYELLSAEREGCSRTFSGVTATVTITAALDCEGVPNGPAIPGTGCDDGSACTTGDPYDGNCQCIGTFADADNDGTCDAEDGCPNDPLKTAAGQCGCGNLDTDGDGDGIADCVDSCPGVSGQIGSPCSDGNPLTTGETLQADCTCGGGVDCNGTVNGTAYHDNCGTCVGGTTGLVACVADCNGVFGGTAAIDQCGVCAGGNTGVVPNSGCLDCAGVPNGGHLPDSCGTCLLPTDPAFSTAVHTLAYSGNGGFTASLVSPQTGSPAGTWTVEAIYTNSEGAALPIGYPRAVLDFEGNGNFTGPWDRTVLMTAVDPADNNTADGKLYRASVVGLAAGTDWQTRIIAQNGNCVAQIGPFNYPDVLDAPDVAIYANDISFSSMNPAVSSALTVTATVRNQSNQPALNVAVSLLNQFDPGTSYPVQYIGVIPVNGTANVVWNITTPAVPAWCPMQVTADADGSIVESNELNNSAIRPFTNGDFDVPGGIVITAAADPPNAYQGTTSSVDIHGRAWYTGAALPMADSSVAGATVTAQVLGGGSFSGTTNATGHYVIAVPANGPLGLTNLNVSTTDYTLVSNTATTSYTQHPPLSCLPDLVVQTVGDQSSILAGGTFSGQFIVFNLGCAATTVPTILTVTQTGGDPIADVTVPPLVPGGQYVSAFGTTFSTAGSFAVCGTADGDFLVQEESENNVACAGINVLPLGPDLVTGSAILGSSQLCNAQQPQFSIGNGGTTAAAASTAEVIVRLNGVTQQTFTQAVGPLAPGASSTFTLAYNYPGPGTYTFEVHCDVPYPNGVVAEANEGNNTALYSLVMAACAPDLAVVGCGPAVNPVDPAFPGTVDYAITLRNEGSMAVTGPVDIAFNVTGQPPVMGQLTGSLAPNAQTTITVNAASVAPATATLTVVADPANALNEMSEANNSLSGGLCVDLKPDSLCFLGQNFWETSYPLNATMVPRIGLRSLGLYKASQAVVRFEVSGPGIVGTALLGDVTVTNLNPTCNCPLPVILPNTFLFSQVGTYTFTITADPLGGYTECSEANNVMVRSVEVTNIPDLRVLSEYIDPSLLNPDPGEPITLNVTYDNMGASNLGDVFELSVAVDEIPHATVNGLPGLLSGTDHSVAIPGTWSSNTVGVHVIRAKIDAGEQVAELSDGNNEATRTIVVGAAANLYFTAFTPSVSAPAPGTGILIQADMANAGDAPVNAELHCFLVTSLQDTLPIGSATFALAANGSTTVNMPWTVTEVPVEILGRITNATVLEFNYNDNGAAFFLDAFDIALAATPGCAGGADGSLSADATNGAAPYTYSWSNGAGSSTIAAQPGSYTVYVVDALGRTASATGVIPLDGTDTDGDGTADCNDACPTDPLKVAPGICGCGTADVATTWYADADGDGFGDPNTSQAGFTCIQPPGYVADNTDLCDGDANKTAPGACGCGTPDTDTDTDGMADCIDPCPNDATNTCNNCHDPCYAEFGTPTPCATFVDTDSDGTCDATDGCDNDPLKTSPVTCGCGNLEPGSTCNDGDNNTINDIVGANCICAGTPSGCANDLTLEFQNDANPLEVTWEILDANDVVVQSGSNPVPANNTGNLPICLPDGCFRLRVLDSGGDGMTTGGYELRLQNTGERLIDNTNNFGNGSVSTISGNQTFCLPIGTDKPIHSSCDKLDWLPNRFVVCHANAAVSAQYGVTNSTSGYEFWFFDPNGSYSYRRFRSHSTSDGYGSGATRACHFKVNGWINSPATPHLPSNTLLNLRVRGRVAGNNLAFGPACQFKIDAALAACPRVKLQDNLAHGDQYSCGVSREFGGGSRPANRIYATPPQPVPAVPSYLVRYQFRFRIPSESICIVRPPQTSARLVLNWTSGTPLECSKTYEVDVRVSLDAGATWCFGPGATDQASTCADTEDWGKVCLVSISGCDEMDGGGDHMAIHGDGQFTLYPNPNHGDQLFVSLSQVQEGVQTVNVDI